ncbi:hypothetical protein [Pseudomonas syringae]|uniref:hypothetical protein n=1 Tax=Pseudomonas syringae TaxID=317 RepID=UPI002009ED0B|nr:hypothetical protein [Pseudomonas syringae]MCK9709876.1 hypothetical protein [Pseudomonas syringae pv. syringae]
MTELSSTDEKHAVDIELLAGSVYRSMNVKLHEVILRTIKVAAETIGWEFHHTREEHELPPAVVSHLVKHVYPAYMEFTRPNLMNHDDECMRQWAQEAIADGWSEAWLKRTLEALAEVGVRLTPTSSAKVFFVDFISQDFTPE